MLLVAPGCTDTTSFYYLAGVDFPGCCVTYEMPHDWLVLWIPMTDSRRALWYGSTPGPEQCRAMSDVDEVRHIGGLERYLTASLAPGRALAPGSILYVLHPNQTPRMESYKGLVQVDTANLKPAMDVARVIKTDYEVAMIKRANAISVHPPSIFVTRRSKRATLTSTRVQLTRPS